MAPGRWLRFCATATALLLAVLTLTAPRFATAQSEADTEWRHFGHDAANTKYSPLDQITPENFNALEIAWRWRSIETEVTRERGNIRPGPFKSVSLMIDGVVYLSTSLGQVAALDAGTGELVWSYDPQTYDRLDRPANMGWQHRGVSYWEDDASHDARIFIATHDLLLVALNARTGEQYADFGADGAVDLSASLGRPLDRSRFTHSQPLAIAGDTVIVGSIVQDTSLTRREADPGHVRGFDARTGEMKWIFHTIPQGEEFGADTWHNESWRYSGHSNVWGTMAVDEELGLRLPAYRHPRPTTGTAACVRATTCSPRASSRSMPRPASGFWHFQAGAPRASGITTSPPPATCSTSRSTDVKSRAIAQSSKAGVHLRLRPRHGRAGLAESRSGPCRAATCRASGTPPDAAVPDEAGPVRSARHHHRRPGRASRRSCGEEAIRIADRAQLVPIFTPPPVRGEAKPIIQSPGSRRGHQLAWLGSRSGDRAAVRSLPDAPARRRARRVSRRLRPSATSPIRGPWRCRARRGLPLVKPPYKRVTAIDLNTGDHVWMAPHGGRSAQPPGDPAPEPARAGRPRRHARRRSAGHEDAARRQFRSAVRGGPGRLGERRSRRITRTTASTWARSSCPPFPTGTRLPTCTKASSTSWSRWGPAAARRRRQS